MGMVASTLGARPTHLLSLTFWIIIELTFWINLGLGITMTIFVPIARPINVKGSDQ